MRLPTSSLELTSSYCAEVHVAIQITGSGSDTSLTRFAHSASGEVARVPTDGGRSIVTLLDGERDRPLSVRRCSGACSTTCGSRWSGARCPRSVHEQVATGRHPTDPLDSNDASGPMFPDAGTSTGTSRTPPARFVIMRWRVRSSHPAPRSPQRRLCTKCPQGTRAPHHSLASASQ